MYLLFWYLMYLYHGVICLCRYLCGNRCICTGLIFTVADALLVTDVSATCSSLDLQMLFSLPGMYNCIYILLFLGFKDTSFANFASTSHVFDNVRMLLIEILHPQPALSKPCGYFTAWGNTLLTKNWYKKFERIWSERWWHLERKFLCYWIWTNMFKAASSKFEFKFICF